MGRKTTLRVKRFGICVQNSPIQDGLHAHISDVSQADGLYKNTLRCSGISEDIHRSLLCLVEQLTEPKVDLQKKRKNTEST